MAEAGKLIVLEGVDGSGKSSQYSRLCNRLENDGISFRKIVFPRYDKESSALIRMYLGGEFGQNPSDVNEYSASVFFAVDRYASFMTDWKSYYENGGLVLADRYTTSNAVHQGAKLKPENQIAFFDWLYDFEYTKLGLPKPSKVIYLDVDLETSLSRIKGREIRTGTARDIHEKDREYLSASISTGRLAAEHLGWSTVSFMKNGVERELDEKHSEIYSIVKASL
ncbi:MAG: deoxynucleoside kinase [Ruminococcaceae bacterium]|nr:deoxynucleoside kinase [Oscillospiraceae bacterium]